MDYEKAYKEALERAKKLHKDAITLQLEQDIKDYEYIFPELKESEDERIRKFLIEDIKDTLSSKDFKHYNPEHTKKLEEALAWLEKQGERKSVDNLTSQEAMDIAVAKCFEQGEQKSSDMSIKEKAHQIAWETSKHYDPLLSKESWCEMAALDMAHWLEKQASPVLFNSSNVGKNDDKVEPKFKVGDWIYHEISGNTFHINKIENDLYVSDEGATISLGKQNDWRTWTIQDAKDGDVLTWDDS